MNAAVIERLAHGSPRIRFAMSDVLYGLIAAIGFTLFVRGRFVIAGDAAALSLDHMAFAGFELFGDAIGIASFACAVMLGHRIFESLLAAWCGLLGCAMQLAASIVHFVPRYVNAMHFEPLQSMALAFLKLNARAFNAGLIFFGLYGLLIGFLIVRSARTAGVLIAIGGLAYVVNSIATIVSAPLSPYVLAVPAVGEGVLIVWLLAAFRRA